MMSMAGTTMATNHVPQVRWMSLPLASAITFTTNGLGAVAVTNTMQEIMLA